MKRAGCLSACLAANPGKQQSSWFARVVFKPIKARRLSPSQVGAVEEHNNEEANITPEQMNNSIQAAQDAFGQTFGQQALQEVRRRPSRRKRRRRRSRTDVEETPSVRCTADGVHVPDITSREPLTLQQDQRCNHGCVDTAGRLCSWAGVPGRYPYRPWRADVGAPGSDIKSDLVHSILVPVSEDHGAYS